MFTHLSFHKNYALTYNNIVEHSPSSALPCHHGTVGRATSENPVSTLTIPPMSPKYHVPAPSLVYLSSVLLPWCRLPFIISTLSARGKGVWIGPHCIRGLIRGSVRQKTTADSCPFLAARRVACRWLSAHSDRMAASF